MTVMGLQFVLATESKIERVIEWGFELALEKEIAKGTGSKKHLEFELMIGRVFVMVIASQIG